MRGHIFAQNARMMPVKETSHSKVWLCYPGVVQWWPWGPCRVVFRESIQGRAEPPSLLDPCRDRGCQDLSRELWGSPWLERRDQPV